MDLWQRLLLAFGSLAALAAVAAAYDCPAATCDAQPRCHCASPEPPGGLAPAHAPQFIVLTNDDAVTREAMAAVLGVTGRATQRNGCLVPATWFVCPLWNASGFQPQHTDPALVRRLFEGGHEIASHTLSHPYHPGPEEILGARAWLHEARAAGSRWGPQREAGVPLEALRGFRAPYLVHDAAQRTLLRQHGFLYDSSMTAQWGPGQAAPNGSARLWPWTLDHSHPISCAGCQPGERQPGLWEWPLWAVQDDGGGVIAWMDPGTSWGPDPAPEVDNFAAYRREFRRSYGGNRAPLGIYLHSQMLIKYPQHQAQLAAFLRWALRHDGVWAATISEVLRWMKDPVPADQYELECGGPATAVS